MKKILSVLFAATLTVNAFSQTLLTDNFNSYNVGNLGTQGGWGRDGGTGAMIKIANIDAAHGRSLQFASTIANADGMWIYKEFDWNTRTSGNELFTVELDVYVPSTYAEVQFYDVTDGYYAIGDVYLSPENGAFLADQNDFDGGTSGQLLTNNITANTWYKVVYTYNAEDGKVTVKIGDNTYGPFESANGLVPGEIDFVASGETTAGFDNLLISAKSTLATSEVSKTKITVYPNPATDVLNITSNKKIDNVSIFDATGKAVKTVKSNTVNVQDLTVGTYVVNIKFEDGTTESKKIIKK